MAQGPCLQGPCSGRLKLPALHRFDELLLDLGGNFFFDLLGPLQQQKWHLLLQLLAHGLLHNLLHLFASLRGSSDWSVTGWAGADVGAGAAAAGRTGTEGGGAMGLATAGLEVTGGWLAAKGGSYARSGIRPGAIWS